MNGTLQNKNTIIGALSGGNEMTGGLGTVIARDGKSAYEVAVKNGFEGNEEEWLESLKGDQGDKGKDGKYISNVAVVEDSFGYGCLVIDVTDPETGTTNRVNYGRIEGAKGDDGLNGASVSDPVLKTGEDGYQHLWITIKGAYPVGAAVLPQEIDLGRVEGKWGEKGEKGEHGEKGDPGEKGDKGESGVYVGEGDMPDGYNVQINPNGSADSFMELVVAEIMAKLEGDLPTSANARIGEVLLLADAWVGEQAPYSQEVSIPTVTPNTQVDLTPSVDQLSIFYNKDLAFVTENEEGVVTVYAIGQKPTRDYTIQVTMTEVSI